MELMDICTSGNACVIPESSVQYYLRRRQGGEESLGLSGTVFANTKKSGLPGVKKGELLQRGKGGIAHLCLPSPF